MTKRSYDQYCGLAAALDLLGERWTMLIVRELLMGPKRFTDLLGGLPGIGTGLLTQRLRELEDAEVVEKAVLPPPAASSVYQLTTDGRALQPALLGLTRWGLRRLKTPDKGQAVDVNQIALAMAARFNPQSTPAADGIYELRIDGNSFHFSIGNGQIEIQRGSMDRAQAVIRSDVATLIALNTGTLTIADALENRSLMIDGETDIALSLASAFGLAK